MNYTLRMFKGLEGSSNKANVKLSIGNAFEVTGIHVRESDKGLYVTMPSYKTKDGKFNSIVNPITAKAREELYDDILSSYNYLQKNTEKNSFIKSNDKNKKESYKVSLTQLKEPKGSTLAIGRIVIDDEFSINNIQIKTGSHGAFVTMPSVKTPDGDFVPFAAPSENFRNEFNNNVLSVFNKMQKDKKETLEQSFYMIAKENNKNNISEYSDRKKSKNKYYSNDVEK